MKLSFNQFTTAVHNLIPLVEKEYLKIMISIAQVALIIVVVAFHFNTSKASSDKKPHGHQGILTPFDGKQIPYSLTEEESKLLDSGKPVIALF